MRVINNGVYYFDYKAPIRSLVDDKPKSADSAKRNGKLVYEIKRSSLRENLKKFTILS